MRKLPEVTVADILGIVTEFTEIYVFCHLIHKAAEV